MARNPLKKGFWQSFERESRCFHPEIWISGWKLIEKGGSAMPDEIEIIIQPTGKVAFRVMGVQGRQCLNITQNIETLLGEIQDRKLSPEYFETPILREIKTYISPEFSGKDGNGK
jgi:hypothetical protein